MSLLGWKYNMDKFRQPSLIGQLERIEALLHKRDALWKRYEEALYGIEGIGLAKTLKNVKHAHHLFTVLVLLKKGTNLWGFNEEHRCRC